MRQRDSSAELTSKYGFSVVAPTSTTSPSSTAGSSVSCCALLKRWISSRKKIVPSPAVRRRCSARSSTSRTSARPALTADASSNAARAFTASSRARVVLPVPGGPYRIIEWGRPSSIAVRSAEPRPRRWSCPTNSPSDAGRIRAASGRSPAGTALLAPAGESSRSKSRSTYGSLAPRLAASIRLGRMLADRSSGCRRTPGPHDEQPLLDPAHHDVAGAEVRVVAPRPVELGRVVRRVDVEEAHLAQGAFRDTRGVEDPQPGAVVGLEGPVAQRVLVVVDRLRLSVVDADQRRRVEPADVEDVRLRLSALLLLVQLVVDDQVALIWRQPALVRVGRRVVARPRELDRRVLVGHVGDRHRVLVRVEADLATGEPLVGTAVVHALRVVRVAVLRHAPGELRILGLADVDHVRPAAAAGARPDRVREPALLVDRDVVRVVGRVEDPRGRRQEARRPVEDERIVRVLRPGARLLCVTQAPQVEH